MSPKKDLVHPSELRYSKEHEWVRVENNEAIIGITDYAQDQLGDVVFMELPTVGAQVQQFKTFGVIESVKAASDLYSPVSGTVVSLNEALLEHPELVNRSSYQEGWMIRVQMRDAAELENLLSADEYVATLT